MSGPPPGDERRLWKVSTLLAAVLALPVEDARAQAGSSPAVSTPAVALSWSGPGPELTCLGEEGLMRSVNEYLGRNAFPASGADFRLSVRVEREADRSWRAVLELRDSGGELLGARKLASSGDLCSSLNEPLTLAVALMVDSEPEPPAPASPPPVAAEPEAAPSPQPSPARRSPQHWALELDAALGVEAGLLPAVRPGLALGLELHATTWLSARVSGVGFLPAAAELEGSAAVRMGFVGGVLSLCPGVVPSPTFRAALCVGPLYGVLLATSRGLEAGRTAQSPLLALTFGPRAAVSLGRRWSLKAEVMGVVPYRPDRFTYELNGATHELFSVSGLSVIATAGASFRF
jgi:hypothetical protein